MQISTHDRVSRCRRNPSDSGHTRSHIYHLRFRSTLPRRARGEARAWCRRELPNAHIVGDRDAFVIGPAATLPATTQGVRGLTTSAGRGAGSRNLARRITGRRGEAVLRLAHNGTHQRAGDVGPALRLPLRMHVERRDDGHRPVERAAPLWPASPLGPPDGWSAPPCAEAPQAERPWPILRRHGARADMGILVKSES
jgi:hypothetical protein